MPRIYERKPPMQRILERTEVVDLGYSTPCWTCSLGGSTGYATMGIGYKLDGTRRSTSVHLVAYAELVGPIPPDQELDHLCHSSAVSLGLCEGGPSCPHRRCWNPEHLAPVTRQVNMLRGNTVAARNAVVTECPKGHEYTPENTGWSKMGTRFCRQCRRDQERERYWRLKGIATRQAAESVHST